MEMYSLLLASQMKSISRTSCFGLGPILTLAVVQSSLWRLTPTDQL